MRYIFLLLITMSLAGQSSSTKYAKDENANSKSKEIQNPREKPKENNFDDDELDKAFYTYYYMNLPKHLQKEDKDKEKLKTNLIRVFKKEIIKRDRNASKETIQNLTSESVRFRRVLENSKWMKKIKEELRYIHFTEYMYIIKYEKYLTLILFHLDPEMHLQSPAQVEFIMVKDGDSIQDLSQ